MMWTPILHSRFGNLSWKVCFSFKEALLSCKSRSIEFPGKYSIRHYSILWIRTPKFTLGEKPKTKGSTNDNHKHN